MAFFTSHPNRVPVLILLAIQMFNLYCMHGFSWLNGYYTALANAARPELKYLPGSDTPLVHRYIGLNIADRILTTAQCLYANFTDGRCPQSSLFNFHFAGQLISVFIVLMMEAYRVGSIGTFLALPLVPLLLVIGIGYGAMMGFYGALHLLFSKASTTFSQSQLAQQVRIQLTDQLKTLPLSISLGYILPTVFMTLPIFSSKNHQYFNALWHQCPFLMTGLQTLFATFSSHFHRNPSTSISMKRNNKITTTDLKILSNVYLFAFTTSAATHLLTIVIFFSRQHLPTLKLSHSTFSDIFIPRPFWDLSSLPDMATGAFTLFQYDAYAGAVVSITWATFLLRNAYGGSFSRSRWFWLAVEIFVACMVAGPAGALISILWQRDEMVLTAALQAQAVEDGKKLAEKRSR